MTRTLVTSEIKASADEVWGLVRDFGGIQRWNRGSVQDISVEGEGLGAIRKITLPGGLLLHEELRAYDEAGRSFSYAIVGKSPLPVNDYLATLTVKAGSAESCTVEWGSTFECGDFPEDQAIPLVESIYKNGIAGIKEVLE